MSSPPPLPSTRSSGSSAASLFQVPTRQVRHHWWQYLMCVWRHISRRSKIILAVVLFSLLLQIAVLSTVVSLSWNKTCDRPLKYLLLAYLVCVILATPLTLYDRFKRAIWSANQQQEQRQQQQQQQMNSPEMEEGWFFKLMAGVLDWLYLLLFLVGNYYFFTSTSCSSTAPMLYYLTLAFLIMGYLMLTVPMLLCGAVVFCLPIMLVSMRMTGMGTMENLDGGSVTGATEESLKALAVWTFRADRNKELSEEELGRITLEATSEEASEKLPNTPVSIMKQQARRWLVIPGANSEKGEKSGDLYVECEDANCIICLECYEEGQHVRQLLCQHLFHQKCVDEWLRLNATCPLCKQPIIDSEENPPLSISQRLLL